MSARPTTLQLGLHGSLTVPADGKLDRYADGGVPLLYYSAEGSTYCADCASQWDAEPPITAADLYHEGPVEVCEGCGALIEAQYGDPDACHACQEAGQPHPPASYEGALLARCHRSGDKLCDEHQRWCWRCQQVFGPVQLPHHLTAGECEGLTATAMTDRKAEGTRIAFPLGMRVLVSHFDYQRGEWDEVPGEVYQTAHYGGLGVRFGAKHDSVPGGHFPLYTVKRQDR